MLYLLNMQLHLNQGHGDTFADTFQGPPLFGFETNSWVWEVRGSDFSGLFQAYKLQIITFYYCCHFFNIFAIEMSKPFKRLLGRLSV